MRLEIRTVINHTLYWITATQLNLENLRPSEEKPRKAMKINLGQKPQVWLDWPNHFESTKKSNATYRIG